MIRGTMGFLFSLVTFLPFFVSARLTIDVATNKLTADTTTVLLNDPDQKRTTRLEMLKHLRSKIKAMLTDSLLAEQKPHLLAVVDKIDKVFLLVNKNGVDDKDKAIDAALESVQEDMNALKKDLMAKALQIQDAHMKALKAHDMRKGREAAFDKLMDVQDAPLSDQVKVLEQFKTDDFVAQFLKEGDFKEGDNLAMRLGAALDDSRFSEKKQHEQYELKKLMNTAHLSQEQAQSLMPILSKIRVQKSLAEQKVREATRQFAVAEEAERMAKKRKAIVSHEDTVLGRAVHAIEVGKTNELTKAMEELQKIQA